MEQLIEVARRLRETHHFRGYIHLKTIPDAAADLIARAGRYADRLSINVELPSQASLNQLAPEKNSSAIRRSMAQIRLQRDAHEDELQTARSARSMPSAPARVATPPPFAPAGQSTQMIVGADASDDRAVLKTAASLYANYRLKRVYYSAFSPIPHASSALPVTAAPMKREHRLYQADWLTRFYGFQESELVTEGGMLSLERDPKLSWALANPQHFPVDLNRAPRETLLRVPGLGVKSVQRLLQARRARRLRGGDIKRLGTCADKVLAFVVCQGHQPAPDALSRWLSTPPAVGVAQSAAAPVQGSLW
jgi:putative DNA modification/repair radical SAM protein